MLNVKLDFNAAADSVTDDTNALQDALDHIKNGGNLFFPAGIYRTSACLIFYSNQSLFFEKGAVLLRGDEQLKQHYILANHTSPDKGGYTACENVLIDGACFDGNADMALRATLLNTCHAKNIVIRNCSFKNGCLWHYIEINSSENAVVDGCVFESSYSTDSEKGEQLQLDLARTGSYGPIIGRSGEEVRFMPDKTVCRNIEIKNCKFYGYGFAPAIGNHGNAPHNGVKIHGNEFIGGFGRRGAIDFVDMMTDIEIFDNTYSE